MPLQAARGGITVAWRKDEIPVTSAKHATTGRPEIQSSLETDLAAPTLFLRQAPDLKPGRAAE